MSDDGVMFSGDAADRIAATVKRFESESGYRMPASGGPRATEWQVVQVTSATPDADGLYPGRVVLRTGLAAYADYADVLVEPLNGEALSARRHPAACAGLAPDGVTPLYLAFPSCCGDVAPPAGCLCDASSTFCATFRLSDGTPELEEGGSAFLSHFAPADGPSSCGWQGPLDSYDLSEAQVDLTLYPGGSATLRASAVIDSTGYTHHGAWTCAAFSCAGCSTFVLVEAFTALDTDPSTHVPGGTFAAYPTVTLRPGACPDDPADAEPCGGVPIDTGGGCADTSKVYCVASPALACGTGMKYNHVAAMSWSAGFGWQESDPTTRSYLYLGPGGFNVLTFYDPTGGNLDVDAVYHCDSFDCATGGTFSLFATVNGTTSGCDWPATVAVTVGPCGEIGGG